MTLLSNHLKIAFRNLWKFRVQTIVCVLGLSVGMACFALGTLWLRYIESFEDFVPDAENVFLMTSGKDNFYGGNSYGYQTMYDEGRKLKEMLPEIKEVCSIMTHIPEPEKWDAIAMDGTSCKLSVTNADEEYFGMFGVTALEGTLRLQKGDAILTKSASRKLFGEESAVGRQIYLGRNLVSAQNDDSKPSDKNLFTVVAVVEDCPHNTQFFYFEALTPVEESYKNYIMQFFTFMKLNDKAARDSIVGKSFELDYYKGMRSYELYPLRELRTKYTDFHTKVSSKFVEWFMLLGVLVILCSLVNYIITMVNHLRRRAWEMSLRRVLGASRKTILAMVSTETFLTFLLAAVFGWLLTWAVIPYFREYSDINLPLSSIFWRVCGYLALVIVTGCALSAFVAWIVMKKTQANILGARQIKHSSTKLDRIGVTIQLALSMGIFFSLAVMFNQFRFLRYSDELGFDHVGLLNMTECPEEVVELVSQSPLVEDYLKNSPIYFPKQGSSYVPIQTDPDVETDQMMAQTVIDEEIFDFYRMRLVAGRFPVPNAHPTFYSHHYRVTDIDGNLLEGDEDIKKIEILVNEATCRKYGWMPESALGKSLYFNVSEGEIVGVVKDVYNLGPLTAPEPILYSHRQETFTQDTDYESFQRMKNERFAGILVIRVHPGKELELGNEIVKKMREIDADPYNYPENADNWFEYYLTSEQMLIRILLAVVLCSLIVCVLGAFSLVSLSLTERRKEIAIRKAHGAHISDILQLFLRSHYLSLGIAACIAYPLSYIIMRNWLEHYTKQVGIDWWLLPATFLLISAVVIATISAKIYFAAKEKAARALAG